MPALSRDDLDRIRRAILRKYEQVARSPRGQFRYPTGRAGLDGQGYAPALLDRLPAAAQACFAGVGNPLALGQPRPGESVLDIGCGAGVDTLLAALLVGPDGFAAGLELSPDMLATARGNQAQGRIGNAGFVQGSAEDLPFADASFDLIVSNGVFNLVADKQLALSEALRVLKPGGRLQLADQLLTVPPDPDQDANLASWFT